MTDAENQSATGLERLGGVIQHLLPQNLLTWIMYRSTRLRLRLWKNCQIRWFIKRYRVDTSETLDADPHAYEHFNAFFTRALRPGSRPIEGGDDTIVSPADGSLSAIGDIQSGMVLQAKGRHYSLQTLLGGDQARAAPFEDGHFSTVYLSPRDYHRVHMPTDGRLREMVYIPGRLFSVNFATARVIDDLFARNERLVCLFDTPLGPMALILVCAMLVAGMETVWSGPLTPPHGKAMQTWRYDDDKNPIRLSRGEEMGRFNTGSTVVLLFPAGRIDWLEDLESGNAVRMGQAIGRVRPAAQNAQSGASTAEG